MFATRIELRHQHKARRIKLQEKIFRGDRCVSNTVELFLYTAESPAANRGSYCKKTDMGKEMTSSSLVCYGHSMING